MSDEGTNAHPGLAVLPAVVELGRVDYLHHHTCTFFARLEEAENEVKQNARCIHTVSYSAVREMKQTRCGLALVA